MSVVEELQQLYRADESLSPSALVEFARANPSSACYASFEKAGMWDDETAAEIARVGFARQLIHRYKVEIIGNDGAPHVVRATVSTRDLRPDSKDDEAPVVTGSYILRTTVMSDQDRFVQFRQECVREIGSLRDRYCDVISRDDLALLDEIAQRTARARRHAMREV
jgi:hypothetical protein